MGRIRHEKGEGDMKARDERRQVLNAMFDDVRKKRIEIRNYIEKECLPHDGYEVVSKDVFDREKHYSREWFDANLMKWRSDERLSYASEPKEGIIVYIALKPSPVPCHRCGSVKIIVEALDSEPHFMPKCTKCGLTNEYPSFTKSDAIRAWNGEA